MRHLLWILKGRSLVRAMKLPQMLHIHHTASDVRPFSGEANALPTSFMYAGLEFFGLLYVKRGRISVQVYACRVVCFSSQAVHVEDVSFAETFIFIQSFVSIYFHSRLSL